MIRFLLSFLTTLLFSFCIQIRFYGDPTFSYAICAGPDVVPPPRDTQGMSFENLQQIQKAFKVWFDFAPWFELGAPPTQALKPFRLPLAVGWSQPFIEPDAPPLSKSIFLRHAGQTIMRKISDLMFDAARNVDELLEHTAEDTTAHVSRRERQERLRGQPLGIGRWYVTQIWHAGLVEGYYIRVAYYEVA